ncbi:MAG TPA: S9 family peptidase [Salinivirgaceae bacterium]|nr:S9 family peptidase [Salinivirgaceae bacterium]
MMRSQFYLLLLFIVTSCQYQQPEPPKANKIPHELTIHGDTRIDNYFWMNQRDSKEVLAYLEAENNYANFVMKDTESLQAKLYHEIKSRIKEQDESVPYFENGYYYYTRYEQGQEYPIYCRRKHSMDSVEEIILDVNKLAEGHAYYQVSSVSVSPDNQIAAYGVDSVSRRRYTIFFKNLRSGQLINTKIQNTTGNAVWANDDQTVFYTMKDTVTLRSNRILRHNINQVDASNDVEVFNETDETFSVSVFKSRSNAFIFINSNSTVSNEYRYLDANKPEGNFSIFQPRERGLEYSVDHHTGNFYVLTNLNAQNFRLMKTPVTHTLKRYWKEVIPHRNDVLLENFDLFANHLIVYERSKALPQIRVINLSTKAEHFVAFDEEVYTLMGSHNPEFNTNRIHFTYTSLTTPFTTYEYNLDTREKTVLKQTEVLGGYDPQNYETKRLWAKAPDGTEIPMSIVYRKGIELNGENPALIYGYGSYGNSMNPYFSVSRISLLDRGFVFAIAHIRGGQEMGRSWYENGKLLKKINTFTDFIACSEFLIEQKYTNPQKLFAQGGSAGGLLVGAVANMRPELYLGIIAQVPFVDVVTTMLDETIPLTTAEYDEWGNPNNPEYYFYMKSYSPYDQVKAQNYPNMLVTTGYHDSQVQYWEPAKWVAKLREMKTDSNKLIFKIDMEAGHGGASGRFKPLKEVAFTYAFMFKLLGITQ